MVRGVCGADICVMRMGRLLSGGRDDVYCMCRRDGSLESWVDSVLVYVLSGLPPEDSRMLGRGSCMVCSAGC